MAPMRRIARARRMAIWKPATKKAPIKGVFTPT
jgi:hypothetical protein